MKIKLMLIFTALCLSLTACSTGGNDEAPITSEETTVISDEEPVAVDKTPSGVSANVKTVSALSAEIKSDSADIPANHCSISIGDETVINGSGAWYSDGVLSISAGGTYSISGTFNGMIYIETDENIMLELNGVTISNDDGPAVYCYNAKNLYLKLADGTKNTISDGVSYSFTGTNESAEDDEPNAALYSKDDVIFCGNGTLIVNGNYNNAISCKDDIVIESGTFTVAAANNGIKGKDSVCIIGGDINLTTGADAIKSSNSTDEGKGYIVINGGEIKINAGEDAIQAETNLNITGGNIDITTTGDVAEGGNDMGFGGGNWQKRAAANTASNEDELSSKGVKAGNIMVISGGNINVSSTDHCVHSGGEMYISGGIITLSSSKGKGISSHGDLTFDGGVVKIENSTEGIESKAVFTINGGDFHITASDDGLNAGGGSDSFGAPTTTTDTSVHDLFINGGYIYIDAAGDGIDSNGNINVTGGTTLVNGPTNAQNGALDCGDRNNTITVNGGTLLAVGAVGMAEAPSANSSTQYSLSVTPTENLNANSTLCIKNSAGESVLTYTVPKNTQNIVFSSPELKNGETYTLYINGTAAGSSTDGLYDASAEYTGTEACSFKISSILTTSGASGSMMGGGNFHGIKPDKNGDMPTPPDDFTPENKPSLPNGFAPDDTPPDMPTLN